MSTSDIQKILRSKQTVFSTDELAMLWQETKRSRVYDKVNHYIKTGQLYSIRKGFYAKDKNYNKRELANKIYAPSYISLYTVLAQEGIVFQYYQTIYIISYLNRSINADGQDYEYHKLKDIALCNNLGIKEHDGYWIATKERAFLDLLYLFGEQHLDSLGPINWDYCYELAPLYRNKSLFERLKSYHKDYLEENA